MLEEDDDLYKAISDQNQERNDSALNMSIPVSPKTPW